MKRRPIKVSGALPQHLVTFNPPTDPTAEELWSAWSAWDLALDDWLTTHPQDDRLVQLVRDSVPVPDQPWNPDDL